MRVCLVGSALRYKPKKFQSNTEKQVIKELLPLTFDLLYGFFV